MRERQLVIRCCAVAASVLASFAVVPAATRASAYGCPRVQGLDPRNEYSPGFTGVSQVSVRNMTCANADAAIRHGYLGFNSSRPIPYNLQTPGYTCNPLSGGTGGATIQCVRGQTAFRFTYGT